MVLWPIVGVGVACAATGLVLQAKSHPRLAASTGFAVAIISLTLILLDPAVAESGTQMALAVCAGFLGTFTLGTLFLKDTKMTDHGN